MATASHGHDISEDAEARDGVRHDEPGPVEDSIGFYLRDIGAFPLLTAREELLLAQAIERGRDAATRLEGDIGPEERAEAERERAQGEAARRRMIECNLRLVVSIASRYGGRGLSLPDLIEEGNLGLIKATDKFDPKRGYRFSTYAVWWIRQAITRGIDTHARTVRLPGHVLERMSHMTKASQMLLQELGREPTCEELARAVRLKVEQVRDVRRAAQRTVSLEQPYGEGGEVTLAEAVEDEGWAQLSDRVSGELLRERVFGALRELSEREQRVIALRYGLGEERRLTLEEAGREIGVTRERVRQIEKEALAKLRAAGTCPAGAELADVA